MWDGERKGEGSGASAETTARQLHIPTGNSMDSTRWRLREEEEEEAERLRPGRMRNVRLKVKCRKRKSEPLFKTGSAVEVKNDEDGYQGAWYSAIVLGSIGLHNHSYLIQYLTLLTDDLKSPLQEVAIAHNVRPLPPPHLSSSARYHLWERVEAWFNDGWWEGVVSAVVTDFKYMVYFSATRENLEFEYSCLRPHHDWINGTWVRGKPIELEVDRRNPRVKFREGTKVEVKSYEAGFQGAWFAATIIEVMENDKFLIEYQSLLTHGDYDNKSHFLREEAYLSDIRPAPPQTRRVYPFQVSEIVDAWHNDGWWVGRIIRVKERCRYIIQFKTSELLEFAHSELRPHQEWLDGTWLASTQEATPILVSFFQTNEGRSGTLSSWTKN